LASLDLSGFNTSAVTEMESMFAGCDTVASLDLSAFNTSSVWNMASMFNGCRRLQTIFAGDGWLTDAVMESEDMFLGCTSIVGGQGTTYDEHQVDAARAHIDGGPGNPGYFTGNGSVDVLRGDVNADGEVTIADVNCVVGLILGAADTYQGRADVNADGEVTVADVNAVIDIILGH